MFKFMLLVTFIPSILILGPLSALSWFMDRVYILSEDVLGFHHPLSEALDSVARSFVEIENFMYSNFYNAWLSSISPKKTQIPYGETTCIK